MFGLGEAEGLILLFSIGGILPWIVAALRNHPQRGAIVALTVFGGWTGLGWLIAMVWACWNFDDKTGAPTNEG